MYYQFTDINSSITALTCSILSHYGVSPVNPTLPDADRILRSAPRNIVLILLDGLGYPILTRHLPENSFLRRQLSKTLSSVFPRLQLQLRWKADSIRPKAAGSAGAFTGRLSTKISLCIQTPMIPEPRQLPFMLDVPCLKHLLF